MGYLQEIPWTWLREIARNGLLEIPVDIFTGFSYERFLGISADFPQNCYLGNFIIMLSLGMQSRIQSAMRAQFLLLNR